VALLSLYRRYRPRRFSEIRGQDHVVRALRNAVAGNTESHAYLFSGPRGTGKTSTARIFAKALNCESLTEGEPCGECDSCVSMDAGRSFDLFELDAASNNGVDAVRELVERAAVGSPGRTKVYILDEVHMLTAAASNALLKTLEEPPDHVRFVLATTDPQKVLPTIRSRTQHYEFHLLSAEELEAYVRWIDQDASLGLDDEAVAHVVRQGRGSARDTLSALDQVVAAGGVLVRSEPVGQLFDAVEAHDTAMAVTAVAEALALGHDSRVLAEAFLGELRDAFLLSVGADVAHLVSDDRERLAARAESMGTRVLARALESVGTALVEMRQAADPRIPLEVALVKLTTGVSAASESPAGADDGRLAALAARVERLEARLRGSAAAGEAGAVSAGSGGPGATAPTPPPRQRAEREAPPANAAPAPAPAKAPAAPPPPPRRPRPAAADSATPPPAPVAPTAEAVAPAEAPTGAESAESAPRASAPAETVPTETVPTETVPTETVPTETVPTETVPTPPADAAAMPDRDAIVLAFGDEVVGRLGGIAKALYANGRFVEVDGGSAVFALENAPTRDRAEQYREEVESLLAGHFGRLVPLKLVVEQGGGPRPRPGQAEPKPTKAPAERPSDHRVPPPTPQRPARPPEGGGSRRGVPPSPPASARAARGSRTPPNAETAEPSVPAERAPAAVAVEDLEEEVIDLSELEDASSVATSGLDKLAAAFPGSELVEEGDDG
jgi:DNA polymerase-3 subunit gamma/tau